MRNPVLLCYWNWVISERIPKRHYLFLTAALCRQVRPRTQAAAQPAESKAATRAPSSSPAQQQQQRQQKQPTSTLNAALLASSFSETAGGDD